MDTSIQSADPVLSELRGSILILTLNRPERLNAWTTPLEDRYFDLLDEAEADPEVRAIVVTGAGRGFCAGADMDDLEQAGVHQNLDPAGIEERARPRSYPRTLRKPIVAAINGPCVGLGLVEALYCDVRFSTPGAKIATTFARRGLIAEYGMAWLLPRIVGASRALDLLISGRTILGEEAFRMGLVDQLAAPEAVVDSAVAYAEDLATNCSPTSMAIIKGQVQRGLEIGFGPAFEEAERLIVDSFRRADVAEGVNSYLEKRPPAFPPLAAPDYQASS
jgi:enoyl-CoA hydratase/carnithine racemase